MPLQIVRNDITRMPVDAIVNAANSSLLGGGGVDGMIHRAAGPQLLEACKKLGGCPTGSAKITKGYRLPSRYVIHAVGPVWRGGAHGEPELLASCYRSALALAKAHRCESVAFPLISSGAYGFPKDQALRIAADTISDFLMHDELLVYIVVFDRASFSIGERLFAGITEYIDDHYAAQYDAMRRMRSPDDAPLNRQASSRPVFESARMEESRKAAPRAAAFPFPAPSFAASPPLAAKYEGLESALKELDESFSQTLLREIDKRGMTDAECYKRANIDRKLFSKIRKDMHYRPSKPTVLAFAIALRMSLSETQALLSKAGFALSHASKFDVIVEYFIVHGIYNIFEINEALFAFDQSLLGA